MKGKDWHEKLKILITICFDSLKTYGKTFEQLDSIVKLFEFALSSYEMERIEKAFLRHVERSADMPTPSDIIKLLDPSKNPRKLDSSVFAEIKRKMKEGNVYVSEQEKAYVEQYLKIELELF